MKMTRRGSMPTLPSVSRRLPASFAAPARRSAAATAMPAPPVATPSGLPELHARREHLPVEMRGKMPMTFRLLKTLDENPDGKNVSPSEWNRMLPGGQSAWHLNKALETSQNNGTQVRYAMVQDETSGNFLVAFPLQIQPNLDQGKLVTGVSYWIKHKILSVMQRFLSYFPKQLRMEEEISSRFRTAVVSPFMGDFGDIRFADDDTLVDLWLRQRLSPAERDLTEGERRDLLAEQQRKLSKEDKSDIVWEQRRHLFELCYDALRKEITHGDPENRCKALVFFNFPRRMPFTSDAVLKPVYLEDFWDIIQAKGGKFFDGLMTAGMPYVECDKDPRAAYRHLRYPITYVDRLEIDHPDGKQKVLDPDREIVIRYHSAQIMREHREAIRWWLKRELRPYIRRKIEVAVGMRAVGEANGWRPVRARVSIEARLMAEYEAQNQREWAELERKEHAEIAALQSKRDQAVATAERDEAAAIRAAEARRIAAHVFARTAEGPAHETYNRDVAAAEEACRAAVQAAQQTFEREKTALPPPAETAAEASAAPTESPLAKLEAARDQALAAAQQSEQQAKTEAARRRDALLGPTQSEVKNVDEACAQATKQAQETCSKAVAAAEKSFADEKAKLEPKFSKQRSDAQAAAAERKGKLAAQVDAEVKTIQDKNIEAEAAAGAVEADELVKKGQEWVRARVIARLQRAVKNFDPKNKEARARIDQGVAAYYERLLGRFGLRTSDSSDVHDIRWDRLMEFDAEGVADFIQRYPVFDLGNWVIDESGNRQRAASRFPGLNSKMSDRLDQVRKKFMASGKILPDDDVHLFESMFEKEVALIQGYTRFADREEGVAMRAMARQRALTLLRGGVKIDAPDLALDATGLAVDAAALRRMVIRDAERIVTHKCVADALKEAGIDDPAVREELETIAAEMHAIEEKIKDLGRLKNNSPIKENKVESDRIGEEIKNLENVVLEQLDSRYEQASGISSATERTRQQALLMQRIEVDRIYRDEEELMPVWATMSPEQRGQALALAQAVIERLNGVFVAGIPAEDAADGEGGEGTRNLSDVIIRAAGADRALQSVPADRHARVIDIAVVMETMEALRQSTTKKTGRKEKTAKLSIENEAGLPAKAKGLPKDLDAMAQAYVKTGHLNPRGEKPRADVVMKALAEYMDKETQTNPAFKAKWDALGDLQRRDSEVYIFRQVMVAVQNSLYQEMIDLVGESYAPTEWAKYSSAAAGTAKDAALEDLRKACIPVRNGLSGLVKVRNLVPAFWRSISSEVKDELVRLAEVLQNADKAKSATGARKALDTAIASYALAPAVITQLTEIMTRQLALPPDKKKEIGAIQEEFKRVASTAGVAGEDMKELSGFFDRALRAEALLPEWFVRMMPDQRAWVLEMSENREVQTGALDKQKKKKKEIARKASEKIPTIAAEVRRRIEGKNGEGRRAKEILREIPIRIKDGVADGFEIPKDIKPEDVGLLFQAEVEKQTVRMAIFRWWATHPRNRSIREAFYEHARVTHGKDQGGEEVAVYKDGQEIPDWRRRAEENFQRWINSPPREWLERDVHMTIDNEIFSDFEKAMVAFENYKNTYDHANIKNEFLSPQYLMDTQRYAETKATERNLVGEAAMEYLAKHFGLPIPEARTVVEKGQKTQKYPVPHGWYLCITEEGARWHPADNLVEAYNLSAHPIRIGTTPHGKDSYYILQAQRGQEIIIALQVPFGSYSTTTLDAKHNFFGLPVHPTLSVVDWSPAASRWKFWQWPLMNLLTDMMVAKGSHMEHAFQIAARPSGKDREFYLLRHFGIPAERIGYPTPFTAAAVKELRR